MAGLIVAYFQFRKRRDGLISTEMEPVFGETYKKPFRNIIDILAIVATVMTYIDDDTDFSKSLEEREEEEK